MLPASSRLFTCLELDSFFRAHLKPYVCFLPIIILLGSQISQVFILPSFTAQVFQIWGNNDFFGTNLVTALAVKIQRLSILRYLMALICWLSPPYPLGVQLSEGKDQAIKM